MTIRWIWFVAPWRDIFLVLHGARTEILNDIDGDVLTGTSVRRTYEQRRLARL
jgi:hypothetical protein